MTTTVRDIYQISRDDGRTWQEISFTVLCDRIGLRELVIDEALGRLWDGEIAYAAGARFKCIVLAKEA